jgi:D-alanine-D-alanine ligase
MDFIRSGEKVDLMFNYAVGKRGRSREAQIPDVLDAFRIPYTGADSFSLALGAEKAITKRIWQAVGLPTPEFCLIESLEDLDNSDIQLPSFPLFVKPVREGSSKGVSNKSYVDSKESLRKQVKYLLISYHQPVLVEKYLPGKEYSVALFGSGKNTKVFGVCEIAFRGKDFFDLTEKKKFKPQSFLPVTDQKLHAQLAELGRQAHIAVDCQEVGRVDIKLDEKGNPSLIEINPNPGLHFRRSITPAIGEMVGLEYKEVISKIIQLAVIRWSLSMDSC